jgi:hypothetical protein
MKQSKKGTPAERLAAKAIFWRRCDKALIVNKTDQAAKDAEFLAKQDLRKTCDETRGL